MPVVPAAEALAQAKAILEKSKIRDLQQLSVVHDGEAIILSGRVSSYYHMQLAQELIRAKVGDVVNNKMHVP